MEQCRLQDRGYDEALVVTDQSSTTYASCVMDVKYRIGYSTEGTSFLQYPEGFGAVEA